MVRAATARLLATAVLTATMATTLAAQQPGSIRGLVRDREFDVPAAGVKVACVEARLEVLTTVDGTYVFPQVPPGRYTLVFSKDGYLRRVQSDVAVDQGRLTDVDVELAGDFTDLDEMLVQDVLLQAAGTEAVLLQLRAGSAALMDSVGAEVMSRAAAGDAATALRLVPGASLQNGKSAVIRGLPDRYVSTQLNGVRLPSADENKRAVELDQFPAAVLESIQVSKTFTPDQQGDASGGAVDVRLKGVPEEPFFLRVKSQGYYNRQVTGRDDFLGYRGGGVGFWGKDGGGRAIQVDHLGDDWDGAVGTSRGEAPTDSKWTLSTGGRRDLGGGVRLGAFFDASYERRSAFFDHGRDDSYWVEQPGARPTPRSYQGTVSGGDFRTGLYDVTQGKQTVKWGTLAAAGLESEHHSITLAFLTTRAAEDKATLAEDTRGKQYYFPGYDPADPSTPGHAEPDAAPYLRLETLDYSERTTQTLQLRGQHRFDLGGGKLQAPPQLDWTLAHSEAELIQPDKRQFGTVWYPERRVGPFSIPAAHRPYKPAANFTIGNLQRIFKSIREDSDEARVDLKLPFDGHDAGAGYLKVGLFRDRVGRRFHQDTFSNFGDNSAYEGGWNDPWSAHFPDEAHPITASEFDVDYRAHQRLHAGYAMVDVRLLPGLDLVGGARLEDTEIVIVNDPEANAVWFPPGTNSPTQLNPGDADVGFRQNDLLPSLGLIARPWQPLTLRASWSRTVARQTFKELTPIQQQEYLGGPVFLGNPGLQMSGLDNYDLRADLEPSPGSLLSVSWFRKDVHRPIEYVQRIASFDYTTAVNYPEGRIYGWEFEARQQLGEAWAPLAGLAVGANATFLASRVLLPDDEVAGFASPGIQAPMTSRPMTNAPRHLYNANLTYDLEATGTQFGVFYTVQGDTLVAGPAESAGNFVPGVYSRQFDTLGFSIGQPIGKHVRFAFGAKNLTDPDLTEVYRSAYTGPDVVKTQHHDGVEWWASLSCEIRF